MSHFSTRLQHLRTLLSTTQDDGLPLDGLLQVSGSDGRRTYPNAILLRYLVFSSSGHDLKDSGAPSHIDDDCENAIEESFLLLTESCLHVFCPFQAASLLTNLSLNVPNICISVLPESVSFGVDNDIAVVRKVSAFKHLMNTALRPGARVGVLLPSGYEGDVNDIERWPLVEAFNNDGKEEYLTDLFDFRDVSADFFKLLSIVDSLCLREAMKGANRLLKNINVTLNTITKAGSRRSKLSEIEVADAIECFYEFGRNTSAGVEADIHFALPENEFDVSQEIVDFVPSRGSRVLFGDRASLINCRRGETPPDSSMEDCLNEDIAHFVLEAEEPLHGVRVARTYFCQCGVIPDPFLGSASDGSSPNLPPSPPPSPASLAPPPTPIADTRRSGGVSEVAKLVNAYSNLLDFQAGAHLSLYSVATSSAKSTTSVKDLTAHLNGLQRSHSPPLYNFVAVVDAVDGFGRSVGSSNAMFAIADVLLYVRFTSTVGNEQDSSTVCVGDTVDLSTSYNITAQNEYLKFWGSASGEEATCARELEHNLRNSSLVSQLFGSASDSIPNVDVILGKKFTATGTLKVYERGFVFSSKEIPPLAVSFLKHVSSQKCCSAGGNDDNGTLLVLKLRGDPDPVQNILNANDTNAFAKCVECSTGMTKFNTFVGLVLPRGTRQESSVLSSIISWREVGEREGNLRAEEDDRAEECDSRGCNDENTGIYTAQGCYAMMEEVLRSRGWKLSNSILDTESFNHDIFMNRCVVDAETFADDDSNTSATILNASNSSSDVAVGVLLLIGLPGSPLTDAGENLINLGSDETEFTTYSEAFHDEEAMFDGIQFAARVLEAYESADHDSAKEQRILVTVSGFIDARKVSMALSSHPNLYLTNVTNVLSSDSLTIVSPMTKSEQWTPSLFDQCASGFTTHILLYENEKGNEHDNYTKPFLARIKLMDNPPQLLGAKLGTFSLEIVASILSDAFNSPKLMEARRGVVMTNRCLTQRISISESNLRMVTFRHEADETDLERLNICLSALLGGVQFKWVSSILADELKDGSIGWNKKARLTSRGATTGIRRCLTLARFKCESKILRDVSLEQLRSDIKQWKADWDALTPQRPGDTDNVGGNKKSPKKMRPFRKVVKKGGNQIYFNNRPADLEDSNDQESPVVEQVDASRIVGLEGILKIDDKKTYKFAGHNNKKNSLHISKGGTLTRQIVRKTDNASSSLIVSCYGLGLTDDHVVLIQSLLKLTAAVKKHALKPYISPDELDVKAVTKAYIDRKLPELWQFDGLNYVNYEGHVRTTRPDIEEIKKLEVERINTERRRYNDAVNGRDVESLSVMKTFEYIKF